MTYKYRFSLSPLVDRDVVVLQLVRASLRDDGTVASQHYLSSKGWRTYRDFDYLQDLIEISGREMSAPLMDVCRHVESIVREAVADLEVLG